jgi:hypothetical protein
MTKRNIESRLNALKDKDDEEDGETDGLRFVFPDEDEDADADTVLHYSEGES